MSNLIMEKPISKRFLSPLGLVAGFLDAAGGGGWGPIATPTLLASGRMQPRKVVAPWTRASSLWPCARAPASWSL